MCSGRSRASRLCERMRRCLLAACVIVSVASSVAVVRADDAAMSRFHHEQGSRAYASGRFEQAVHEFMTAQRLSPNPRTLYNIGLCFLRMSRHDDAFFFLDEYLASTDDAEGVEERRRFATESLRALAPRVARVSVSSTPAGATIYVDQREHGSYGRTPRVLALPPGAHRIWVELAGHRIASGDVTASTGSEVSLALGPELIVGTIVVRAREGSRVRVLDGNGIALAEGAAPLEVAVPPGRVEIEVSLEGYRSTRELAVVAADARTELEVSLEALPQPTGDLTVTANVGDAVVELDGAPVGLAPLVLVDVATGAHHVVVTSPGRLPWTSELDVEAGTRSWATVELVAEPEGRSPWTWVVGGLGIVALAASATMGGLALDRAQTFEARWNSPGGGPVIGFRQDATTFALGSDIALGGGLAALGVATLLFFLTDDSDHSQSRGTLTRRAR